MLYLMSIHCLLNIQVDMTSKGLHNSKVNKYMKLHYFSPCKLHFDHKVFLHMVHFLKVNMSLNKVMTCITIF